MGNARRADADLSKLGSQPLAQQAIRDTATLAANITQISDAQQRLADRAALAARGLDTIGGAAKLTSKELDQINRTLQTGLDAFRALGQEAPKDLQKMAEAVTKQQAALKGAGSLTNLLAQATGLLTSTLGAVGLGASLVAVTKAALADADALVKMHDKTGIAIGSLQLLQIAGDDAGNSLDEITGAVNKMQQRIAGGDQSAVAALSKLGISFSTFRELKPDQQFIQIGDAIAKVQDPADQVRLAVALFGKTGAEVLPTLKRGFDDLKDSAILLGDETVKGLDKAGDALAAFVRREKSVISGTIGDVLIRAKADIDSLRILFGGLPDLPRGPASRSLTTPLSLVGSKDLPGSGLPSDVGSTISDLEDHFKRLAKAQEDAAKAAEKFRDSVQRLSFKTFIADLFPMVGLIQDISDRSGAFREHLDDLTSSFNEFHGGITVAGDELQTVTIPMFALLPNVVPKGTKAIDQAREALNKFGSKTGDAIGILNSLDRVLSNINNRFVEVAVVGLRAASEIAKIAEKASNAGEAFSKGDWLAIAAIGISAVATAFGKLFGNNAEKQINPIREAFVQTAGGLAILNQRALEAGVTLTALLNAKNPEAYKKAIDDLNAAFKFQDDAMATLDQTIQKYGFSISQLGPAFRQQKLDEQAGSLIQDYRVLIASGIENVTVLEQMAPAMNEYLKTIQTAGGTIPTQLRAPLQKLLELGLLTDVAGDKLTDLEGLTFAETLDKKFTTLIDTIQKLADAISRSLGTAIDNLPDRTIHIGFDVDRPPGFGFDDENHRFAASGGLVTATGLQHFGTGGRVLPFLPRGTDRVPAMLTPGELVLNVAQQRNVADGLGGGGSRGPVSLTFVLPPGDYNNPQALAAAMLRILAADTGFVRTGLESLIDRRVA